MSFLVKSEIDINDKNRKSKRTALCEAVISGNHYLVKALLDAGADPNIPCDNDHFTPLDYSLILNNELITQLLIAKLAKTNKNLSFNV